MLQISWQFRSNSSLCLICCGRFLRRHYLSIRAVATDQQVDLPFRRSKKLFCSLVPCILFVYFLFCQLTQLASWLAVGPVGEGVSSRNIKHVHYFRRLPNGSDQTKWLLTHPTPQENQTWCPLQTSDNRGFAGIDRKGEMGTKIALIIL